MTDKKFYQSKKWISWFIALLVVSGILVTALLTQTIGWPLALFMGLGILIIGVMSVAYINGQATLDKFIEGVKSISGKIKTEEDND